MRSTKFILLILLANLAQAGPTLVQVDVPAADLLMGAADERLQALGEQAAAEGLTVLITAPPYWLRRIGNEINRGAGDADISIEYRETIVESVIVRLVAPDPSAEAAREPSGSATGPVASAGEEARQDPAQGRTEPVANRSQGSPNTPVESIDRVQAAGTGSTAAAPEPAREIASEPTISEPASPDPEPAREAASPDLEPAGEPASAPTRAATLARVALTPVTTEDPPAAGDQDPVGQATGGLDRSPLPGIEDSQSAEASSAAAPAKQSNDPPLVLGSAAALSDQEQKPEGLPAADDDLRLRRKNLEEKLANGQPIEDEMSVSGLRAGDILITDGKVIAVARASRVGRSMYWLTDSIELDDSKGIRQVRAGVYEVTVNFDAGL